MGGRVPLLNDAVHVRFGAHGIDILPTVSPTSTATTVPPRYCMLLSILLLFHAAVILCVH